jgi:protein tyrosine phosphatase
MYAGLFHPTRDFYQTVIEHVKTVFVKGELNKVAGLEKIEHDTQLKARVLADVQRFPLNSEQHRRDLNPLSLIINTIHDTPYIASCGPRYNEVSDFITSILTTNKPYIIALGKKIYYHPDFKSDDRDWYDYCTKKRTFKTHDDKYLVEVIPLEGLIESIHLPDGISEKPSLELIEAHTELKGISHSKLKITNLLNDEVKEVTVTSIALDDDTGFAANTEEQKELIWHLAMRNLDEEVYFHCRAGLGRTGFFILQVMLVRHYNEIFSSTSPEIVADKIMALIDRIRETRPGLILEEEQWIKAVQNAHAVQQYAIDKGFIVPEESLSEEHSFKSGLI